MANSMVESIRMHSRGSCDSGVEVDHHSPLRKPSLQCTYDNKSYVEDGGDCMHYSQERPLSSTNSTITKPMSRPKFLGEDLPGNGAMELAVFNSNQELGYCDESPGDQFSIVVPLIPGQLLH